MKTWHHKLSFYLFLWFIYTVVYSLTQLYPSLQTLHGTLALIGEAGLDFVCMLLAWCLFKKTQKPEKNIFAIFVLSFLFSFISDATYNVIVNIAGMINFPPLMETIFDLPFALALFTQAIAWIYIYLVLRQFDAKKLILPGIIAIIAFSTLFYFSPAWHISKFSAEGLYNIIDTVIEAFLFVFLLLAIYHAENYHIKFIALGFLIVIVSDFMIRCLEVYNLLIPGTSLETTWVLGLLLFAVGLARMCKQKSIELT